MKKTILAGSFALAITMSGVAQSSFVSLTTEIKDPVQKEENSKHEKSIRKEERALRRAEVSNIVIRQFQIDFPDAQNASFTVGNNFDEVCYSLKGGNFMAFYDADAALVGTTEEKKYEDLPLKGQEEISTKYSDYNVDQVILFDDNEGNSTDMSLYGTAFPDEDNYFVELSKPGKKIIVQVNPEGQVSFFKNM